MNDYKNEIKKLKHIDRIEIRNMDIEQKYSTHMAQNMKVKHRYEINSASDISKNIWRRQIHCIILFGSIRTSSTLQC